MNTDNWIAVDWGTTHLRTWHMNSAGDILSNRCSDQGMNSLLPDQFEAALLSLISPWLADNHSTQVLACGMVGSRQGWLEASYNSTPCAPISQLTQVPVTDVRIEVYICPGVKQLTPADVMRGEETQIAGLLASDDNFNGAVCLPGTHSKWAQINDGKISSFQTFLTGELYALLAQKSVLRHSVDCDEWDDQVFELTILECITRPDRVTAELFSIRAQTLIADLSAGAANARLSGLLIGIELTGAKVFTHKGGVALVGEDKLCQLYAKALKILGATATIHSSEQMTLKGLFLAKQQITGA
ncbi:MAG: 2-dehydro-3-deoxygalactonokinase [Oceanospirillaceae bacterium]|nr:2-dehydro-3-deoxygalactonokinase [Oceanospirillaceae bacterium]